MRSAPMVGGIYAAERTCNGICRRGERGQWSMRPCGLIALARLVAQLDRARSGADQPHRSRTLVPSAATASDNSVRAYESSLSDPQVTERQRLDRLGPEPRRQRACRTVRGSAPASSKNLASAAHTAAGVAYCRSGASYGRGAPDALLR